MHSTIRPKSARHHTLKAAPLAGARASIGVAFDFQELLRSTTTDTAAAVACLRTLFETTEGPINLCTLSNSDIGSRAGAQETSRDPTALEKFVLRNDIPKWGSYFCVSTMRISELRHAKDSIAETPALHVDIDFKDITDKRDDVIRKLKQLRYPPSLIIDTGNGVHGYWQFKEAITYSKKPKERDEEIERIEAALKLLCDLVGGDNEVTQPSAVMRLPGTHNSKFGEWKQVVVVEQNKKRYELSDLEEWLSETSPIILRKGRPLQQRAGDTNYWKEYAEQFKPPIDVEQRLADMMYMAAGQASVHQTQLSVTASMTIAGRDAEEIVELVMASTRAAAGDYGKRWNWKDEDKRIRRMIADAKKKIAIGKLGASSTAGEQRTADGATVVDFAGKQKAKQDDKDKEKDTKSKSKARGKASGYGLVGAKVLASLEQRGIRLLTTRNERSDSDIA